LVNDRSIGGVILASKPAEDRQHWQGIFKKAGRPGDLLVFGPDMPWRCNVMNWELRSGADSRELAGCLMVFGETLRRAAVALDLPLIIHAPHARAAVHFLFGPRVERTPFFVTRQRPHDSLYPAQDFGAPLLPLRARAYALWFAVLVVINKQIGSRQSAGRGRTF
jgi:hypothetical protein